MFITIALIILGLSFLIAGGHFLVTGSLKLAIIFRISPAVAGLTILSFGTSAPELLVSLYAVFSGIPDIAIGNVIGSNISNITFVLGIICFFQAIVNDRKTKNIDLPFMIAVTVIFYFMSLNGWIYRWEGICLIIILVFYLYLRLRISKANEIIPTGLNPKKIIENKRKSLISALLFSLAGIIMLYFGSEWFVTYSSILASELGVSDRIIGLTLVAIGTSLPELFTSLFAIYKREGSMALGNIIGSNIFNILSIIGITSILMPIEINREFIVSDYNWLFITIIPLIFSIYFRKHLFRFEGLVFFLLYVIYLILLLK